MKPFKTLVGLILTSSALFLFTSCSKNMDEQMAKGENEVGKFALAACEPFVGLQIKQNNPTKTYVFYGSVQTPAVTQAFWGGNFTANNLLAITATGGTPNHSNSWNFIGVTDEWVDGAEVLSLKLNGTLAGKAANKMTMQIRARGLAGSADFYLAGVMVGSKPLSSGPVQEIQQVVYEAVGALPDFDEVRFSVTAGRLALTGYTPTTMTAGDSPSGFYLVEAPGRSVVARFLLGSTVIDGQSRPNQFFTFESSYGVYAPAIERQNRLASPSGEFPAGQWVGAKHWVNIWGSVGVSPSPLGWGSDVPAQMRLGVNNALITGTEVVTITPGANFPNGGATAKFRAVQVRTATIAGAKMLVKAWMGATMVGSATSSGVDASYVLLAPGADFNRVTIEAASGTDLSVGRISASIAQAIRLYPACP